LRTMKYYFVVQASGLNERPRAVGTVSQQPSRFGFSIPTSCSRCLDCTRTLPDEGSRGSCSSRAAAIKQRSITLRVLPPPLDEMKRAITQPRCSDQYEDLFEALGFCDQAGIPGITEKFLRLSASRGGSVSLPTTSSLPQESSNDSSSNGVDLSARI